MSETITTNSSFSWRTSGGDNTRQGRFSQKVQVKVQPFRSLKAQGSIQASVVFDRPGSVFIADMAGGVQAYNREGKERWRIRLDGGILATPVLHPQDDRLFVGTLTGWVFALNTENGQTVWKQEIPTKSDPRILSDLLYLPQSNAIVLTSWGGQFHLLDADSGQIRASWDAGISPYSAATASSDGTIYCLRAVWEKGIQFLAVTPSGEEKVLYTQSPQKKPVSRLPVSAAPVIDPDRGIVYFIANLDRESRLHAASLADGAIQWGHPLPCNVNATPVLFADGSIAVAGLDGFVYGVSPDQSLLYRYASGCEYLLSGAICDREGILFIGDPLGCIHQIDPQGIGRPFFEAERAIQARPSWNGDGDLYVPSTDRNVYVFQNILS